MALFDVDPLTSPTCLKAKTTGELERLIIKYNLVNKTQVNVINVYFDGTYHNAWFNIKRDFKKQLTNELKKD